MRKYAPAIARHSLLVFCAWLAGVLVRLSEASKWLESRQWVDGLPLAGTPDAYAWLAGSIGVGAYQEHVMARALVLMHATTGLPMLWIAWLAPVVIAPLIAIPVYGLTYSLGEKRWALLAALTVAVGEAYLARTRLGFYDTDLVALPSIVAIAWCLASISEPRLQESTRARWGFTLLLGALTAVSLYAYRSAEPIVISMAIVIAMVAVAKRMPGWRTAETILAGVALGVALANWAIIAIASGIALLCLVPWTRAYITASDRRCGMIMWVAGVLIIYRGLKPALHQVVAFAKVPLLASGNSDVFMPSIYPYVAEIQPLPPLLALIHAAGNPMVTVVGIVGLLCCVRRNRRVLVLAPMTLLGLSAVVLGQRFTMYALPAIGVGLSEAWGIAVRRYEVAERMRRLCLLVLVALIILAPSIRLRNFELFRRVGEADALALMELRTVTREDAVLWLPWDTGYAAEYFAERDTIADGARDGALYVVPYATVLTAESMSESAHVMQALASDVEAGLNEHRSSPRPLLVPTLQSGRGVLGRNMGMTGTPARRQHVLIVSGTAMSERDLYWRFSSWFTGSAKDHCGCEVVKAEINVSGITGEVQGGSRSYSLSELWRVDEYGIKRERTWASGDGAVAIVHAPGRWVLLCGPEFRASVLATLYLEGGSSQHYRLLLDRPPWLRAFELRSASSGE